MTQAASIKGVSQPGLSRVIRELETRMRTQLLRRTGRGVELTPAGQEFLTFARGCIADLESVKRRIRDISGAMPERLSIAIPPRLGSLIFPEIYRRFMQAMPEVTIHAREATTEDMADGINAGRYDLLVSYLPSAPGAGRVETAFTEDLYLVGRPSGLTANDAPIELSALAGRPIMLNSRTSRYRRLIESAYSAAGLAFEVSREIETADGLLAFAREGEGLTILPYSNFHEEAARSDVIGRKIVNPSINRPIQIHAARHLEHRTAMLSLGLVRSSLNAIAARAHWAPATE